MQNIAGVGEEGGLAVQLVHGHQQLSGWTLLPWFNRQGSGNRQANAVRIADFQTETGLFYGRTLNVQRKDRCRQCDALLEGFGQRRTINALAAHDTVHIGNKKVNKMGFRMRGQKGLRFLDAYRLTGRGGDGGYSIRSGLGLHGISPVICKIYQSQNLHDVS